MVFVIFFIEISIMVRGQIIRCSIFFESIMDQAITQHFMCIYFLLFYIIVILFFNIAGMKENTTDLFNIFFFALPFCQIDATIYSQTIIF